MTNEQDKINARRIVDESWNKHKTKVFSAALALLLCAFLPTSALAANVTSGSNDRAACPSTPSESPVRVTTPGGVSSSADLTPVRGPDPVQALPGVGSPQIDFPVVSQSTQTYTEGGLTHTIGTIIRSGIPRGIPGVSSSGGGHLAALSSGACTLLGRNVIERFHTICGGGCLTQWMRRTVDQYSNPNALNYYDRIEVRLWWVREYSTGLYFEGPAYTEWRESVAFDCDGVNQGRTTWSSFTPQWNTWDRTYDYYWDETWLPTVTPTGAGTTLYVFTDTPESFGPTLHTEVFLY
jgi:hypothetical protein